MKKITCKEMGGVCDTPITGNTSDEIAKKGKSHVHSMNDDAHKALVEKMKGITEAELAEWKKMLDGKFGSAPDA
jgi:hypothetical protein